MRIKSYFGTKAMRSAASELPSRPPRDTLFEIAALSVLFTFAALVPVAASGVTGEAAWSLVIKAGELVLAHIGWAFGVFVPVLISFYAIVIGGQLAETSSASSTQRILGTVAEMMMASLAPALVALALACVAKPTLAGALLLVIPAAAAALFLAVQLGGFVVFESMVLLEKAEKTRQSMAKRAEALRFRSRRNVWLVFFANVLTGLLLSLLIVGCLDPVDLFSVNPAVIVLVGLLVSIHAMACFFAVWATRYSDDRSLRGFGWAVGVAVTLILIIVTAPIAVGFGWPVVWVLFGAATFTTISALWRIEPRRDATLTELEPSTGPVRTTGSRVLANWTIRGAVVRYAAISVATTYAQAVRDIVRLKADLKTPSLRQRIKSAIQGFRLEQPSAPAR